MHCGISLFSRLFFILPFSSIEGKRTKKTGDFGKSIIYTSAVSAELAAFRCSSANARHIRHDVILSLFHRVNTSMRFIFSVLSILISLVASFALVEAYTRLTQTDGSNFDIEMWRYARELKRESSIPGMGHEHTPGKSGTFMGVPVKINSSGWRDSEHELKKPAQSVRIMMLGDSLTFGWGAPPDGITSNILEKMLNTGQGTRKFEVLNTGIGNTNTSMQTAYFLAEGYRYKPDIVVLNYFINDAEPTPKRRKNWLVEYSYAAVFLAGRFDILKRMYFKGESWLDYYKNLYGDDREGWKQTKQAFNKLASYCQKNNIKLLVAHYPELHQLDPYPFTGVTEKLKALSEKSSVPFVDLLPGVKDKKPESLWVTPTDAHPNKIAGEAFAGQIEKALKSHFSDMF